MDQHYGSLISEEVLVFWVIHIKMLQKSSLGSLLASKLYIRYTVTIESVRHNLFGSLGKCA